MVGWFSSATDETVLFNFHSYKSLCIIIQSALHVLLGVLYAIYGTRCVSVCCRIKHLVNDVKFFITPMPYNQVIPPLMCSLLDRVPESKEIQPGSIQPYSAGPAELSVLEPVVEVSVILMSSLVFTLCGTLCVCVCVCVCVCLCEVVEIRN